MGIAGSLLIRVKACLRNALVPLLGHRAKERIELRNGCPRGDDRSFPPPRPSQSAGTAQEALVRSSVGLDNLLGRSKRGIVFVERPKGRESRLLNAHLATPFALLERLPACRFSLLPQPSPRALP